MNIKLASRSKQLRKGMAEIGGLRETRTGALGVWPWGWPGGKRAQGEESESNNK